MTVTGFKIIITPGMGRFLCVYPHPDTSLTLDQENQVLAAFRRLWPNQTKIGWKTVPGALMRDFSRSTNGHTPQRYCQMLYVGRCGDNRRITDPRAMMLITIELRKLFPGAEFTYPRPSR